MFPEQQNFRAVILSEASVAFAGKKFRAVILSETSAAFAGKKFRTVILSETSAAFADKKFRTVIPERGVGRFCRRRVEGPLFGNCVEALFGSSLVTRHSIVHRQS